MSVLPLLILSTLTAILGTMFLFILSRRAWRSYIFWRRDRFREYWLERLPALLQGATPTSRDMQNPEAREALEAILLHRLETSGEEDRARTSELFERSGLLDSYLRSLQRGSRWRRLEAVAGLGRIHTGAAVPALEKALEDRWPPVRVAALRSLAAIGSPAAAPALLRLLRQETPVEPGAWLDAASACVPDPHAFLPLLQEGQESVRALAARAIAESSQPLDLDSLSPLAFDPDPEVRAQAMRALGRCPDRRALPLLIAGTQDEAWFVRLRAVVALGESGAGAGVDAILRATGDPNFLVRQRASGALASLVTSPGEVLEMLASTRDRYAVEGFLSQLARAGLLWRSLPLLRSPELPLRADAEKLLSLAVAAGYHRVVLHAIEAHPEWRVRVAAARLLALVQSAALVDELRQRVATAPSPRARRLLRAVLRSQLSLVGEQTSDSLAQPV